MESELVIRFEHEDDFTLEDLKAIIAGIAPYMVDNVEIRSHRVG